MHGHCQWKRIVPIIINSTVALLPCICIDLPALLNEHVCLFVLFFFLLRLCSSVLPCLILLSCVLVCLRSGCVIVAMEMATRGCVCGRVFICIYMQT